MRLAVTIDRKIIHTTFVRVISRCNRSMNGQPWNAPSGVKDQSRFNHGMVETWDTRAIVV